MNKKNTGWEKNKQIQPLLKWAWTMAIDIEPTAIISGTRFNPLTVKKVANTLHKLGALPNKNGLNAYIHDISIGVWGAWRDRPEMVKQVGELRKEYMKLAQNKLK